MAGVSAVPRPSYLRPNSGGLPPTAPQYPLPTAPQTTPYGQTAPPLTSTKPTFQPPATGIDPTQAISSQPDPRIAQLVATLSANRTGPSQNDLSQLTTPSTVHGPDLRSLEYSTVQGPDFSGINQQASKVRDLLATLARGEAPSIGDINADPAAIAFRVSQDRSAARGRVSEAARLGASGASGGGDFEARAAQLAETAGENTANFTGNLASQRRSEAIQAAEASAGLQMQDLNRQTSAEQARYGADLTAEQLRREGITASETARYGSQMDAERSRRDSLLSTLQLEQSGRNDNTAQMQRLLETLLSEQGRVQSQSSSDALTAEQLRRQEIERGRLYQFPQYPTTHFPAGQAR